MTLYRTVKVAVALLLAIQLGVSFTGSTGNPHAFHTQPNATAPHGETSGLSENAQYVSFASLIYRAYP